MDRKAKEAVLKGSGEQTALICFSALPVLILTYSGQSVKRIEAPDVRMAGMYVVSACHSYAVV